MFRKGLSRLQLSAVNCKCEAWNAVPMPLGKGDLPNQSCIFHVYLRASQAAETSRTEELLCNKNMCKLHIL